MKYILLTNHFQQELGINFPMNYKKKELRKKFINIKNNLYNSLQKNN